MSTHETSKLPLITYCTRKNKYMVYHTQFHCAHTELKKFLSKVFMVIDGTIDVTSVNRNCNLNKALDYAIHQLVFSVAMEYL